MLNWFSRNKYPKYWLSYLDHFKKRKQKSINNTRFVVFDTETTGLEKQKDRILSIGAIGIRNNEIYVSDSLEVYIKQDIFTVDTVEIHGILKEGSIDKVNEEQAIIQFLDYIKGAVLIAHHAAFDIAMINESLKRMNLPRLKNKSIDTGILYKKLEGKKDQHYGLDKLCDEFEIPKHDRHTASGDALLTGIIFLKILSRLRNERNVHFSDLFRASNNNGLM